jgi:hypothetical protein
MTAPHLDEEGKNQDIGDLLDKMKGMLTRGKK